MVPVPTRFFLDGNVYDLLADDLSTRALATRLAGANRIEFVASPILLGELKSSPFGGLPDWFPVKVLPEGIAISGVARSGMARASAGIVFKQHLGGSRKGADAIIAHSAHSMRAVLVSEDHRCRERLKALAGEAHAMNYEQFKAFLARQPE